MRRFIFASHHQLAYGLKDSVDFLTSNAKKIYDINAYMSDDENDLTITIQNLFATFDKEDEVIVLVDLMGGSVYQKFFPYVNDHVHVICGMSLPLAMNFVLASENQKFTTEKVASIVNESKNQIVYVNQIDNFVGCDDE